MRRIMQIVLGVVGVHLAVSAAGAQDLLFVVRDASSLEAEDTAHKSLFEQWGWTVALISQSASQSQYDDAVDLADVVYITENVDSGVVGTKLLDADIGVVVEEHAIFDDMEFCSASGGTFTGDEIQITSVSHYITETVATGVLELLDSAKSMGSTAGTTPGSVQILATRVGSSTPVLGAYDFGAVLDDGSAAAGRRVFVPWGTTPDAFWALNDDGKVLMRRSLEWAAGPAFMSGTQFALEAGRTTVGATPKRVSFETAFVDPVVVCCVYYNNNTAPVVARVDAVDGSGFDVWLQNPGDLVTESAEKVAWIAVESGAWEVGGHKIEAQKYVSSVTDRNRSWNAEERSYLQAYTNPVVIGQVMSANDPSWSVFWARGSSTGNPPSSSQLYVGKHVGEDSDTTRADETVGFIVFEQGHGEINGVPFDAVLTSDTVRGMNNNPPHDVDFYSAFGAAPGVVIASSAAMDGGDGGWPVMYGSPHASATEAYVTIDEDVIRNSERSHTTEQIALVSFLTDGLLFEDVSGSSGFNVSTTSDDDWGAGLMWGDMDHDGDVDAVVTGNSSSYVMRNTGGMFAAEAMGTTIYRQGALFDLDNDGDLDVFGMQSYSSERVLTNNGSGALTDQGDLGFMNANNMEGIGAGDIDGDGWCDLIVFSQNANWFVRNEGEDPSVLIGSSESAVGLNDSGDYGNGDYCSSADVNNDGHLDYFYHYGGGKLFISNGDGTFTQNNFGISVVTGNNDKMGSAWGDYDNDGDVDLWVSRFDSGQSGYLWRNDVDWEACAGSFSSQSSSAGLTDTTGQRGAAWGDYDNDGDLDLYVVTRGTGSANLLYMNNNDGTFALQDVGAAAPGDGHDGVFVDFDNDGDLDLAVTQEDAGHTLLENMTDDKNYLKVRVIGGGAGKTNVAGVGVRVELWSQGGGQFIARRELGTARGFGGTEPLWAHFGGVDPDATYVLKVYFTGGFVYEGAVVPSVASTTIGATTIDQMVTIDESSVRSRARVVQWNEVEPH